MSKFAAAGAHPPPGTLIDNDTLELVELVGTGGYGVVYRAVETTAKPGKKPRTFAVKVLSRTDGRRNSHIREASLHYHVSGHPHVIDLYQVLEDDRYMYFVMQYARSKDLFHQILNNSYYLGNDNTTKIVFLQLLDAVEHLHKMGVYHRDLKPENILCLDDGYRIAISDFGLATTDKSSVEFRTGSVYHMSPECQSGRYTEDAYSPMANDVWSLGIVLLNMVTGRNPWKSATVDDPVFQSYCRSPFNFFCSVLPVSTAFNKILIQVLDPNWKTRMTLPRLRQEVEKIDTFYGPKVVFSGSLARCPWETDVPTKKNEHHARKPVKRRPVPPAPLGVKPFAHSDREVLHAPAPQPGKGAQPDIDKSRLRAQPAPSPRVAPPSPEGKTPADDLCDSSMESVSLGDADSSSRSTLDDRHVQYISHTSSMSSGPSFPKTPDNGGFMAARGKNKIDVKIMASTHVSPSTSFSGQTHASSILDEFSTYLDLTLSDEHVRKAPDQTMLSPAPSQYSFHEASDYPSWADGKTSMAQDRRRLSSGSHPDGILYPEMQAPAASQPIDIAGSRRRPSRLNMFDNPYYQPHSTNHQYPPHDCSPRPSARQQYGYAPRGRVAAMRKLWEKKLPSKPFQSYGTGHQRSTRCNPPSTGRYWFSGKIRVA